MVFGILFAAGVIAFVGIKSNAERTTEEYREIDASYLRVRDALVAFVATNGYLPCPADGAAVTGLSEPTSAATNCTHDNGIVPWTTLGLSEANGLDAYGNRLSYRVYDGTTGFTQTSGASMANCDTERAALANPYTGATTPSLTCKTDHNTSPTQFSLTTKGLSVNNAGTTVPNVAFVIVSHGKNALGAYNRQGVRQTLPNAASTEYGHTQGAGPFVVKAASTTELQSTDVAYYDDVSLYLTFSELTKLAKVEARNWPDTFPDTMSSATFGASAVQAAATAAGNTVQQVNAVAHTLNTNTLTFNNITITASGAAGNEIATRVGTSGEGIGVIANGGTTLSNIQGTDVLTFTFLSPGRKLGLMLVDFGSVSGAAERSQLVFKNGATTVLTTTIQSCRAGSVLASYTVDPGADFDSVSISALTRVSSGSSSDFTVGEIKLCPSTASTCTTTGASASNMCTYP